VDTDGTPGRTEPVRVTLVGRAGCHLCEDAHAIVEAVLREFPAVMLEERSILDEPELFDAHVEEIPVILIDDRVHTVWKVDAARLRAALAAASAPETASATPLDAGAADS